MGITETLGFILTDILEMIVKAHKKKEETKIHIKAIDKEAV